MKILPDGLDYNDVALIPDRISHVPSRSDIVPQAVIGDQELRVPIIAAPMKDVCNGQISKKMSNLNAYGIIHRFSPIDEQVAAYKEVRFGACAIGINGDYIERFSELVSAGCRSICLDVANGANIHVRYTLEKLLSIDHNVKFIIGNIASVQCFKEMQDWPGVIAIRVGIASGKSCTTKNATGIYSPMLSLIQQCALTEHHTAILADGGIREPSDFCKAIAAGADAIILGSVIANTKDSPAELINKDGTFYKMYHGSASFEIQRIYKNNPKYIEGKLSLLPYLDESLSDMIYRFMDGLVSSMSYFNARTIQEYQENANWIVLK